MPGFPEIATLTFGRPAYLWLLVVPAMLLILWIVQAARRRLDVRRMSRAMAVPVRNPLGWMGDLAFWIFPVIAASLCILALAWPQARVASIGRAGADVIILLDASASMYVTDMLPSRWQRSQQFIRSLAEAISWEGDRAALALFAHRAAPQLRLTRDPNALFFFLDHLGEVPPFPLRDDTTWDTNIEEGLYWGIRLVEKDEEMFGRTSNAKAFLVISDGQAWSGEVNAALELAREKRIPVHVVGVGTTAGGLIPEPEGDDGIVPPATVRSVLDRDSLREIARLGNGEYHEIGLQPDQETAFRIVGSIRRRAAALDGEPSFQDIYWHFLAAAAAAVVLGTVLLRPRTELRWQIGAAAAGLMLVLMVAL